MYVGVVMRRTWLIIREVSTDEVRIASVAAGQRPEADAAYRCHGPFQSRAAAQRSLTQRSSVAYEVLYGDGKQFVTEGA